jgi:serine/threonine-protein kinase
MAEPGATTGTVDEGLLFEELCELDAEARAQRLQALEQSSPALAARLRRLLEIDVAYGAHTARNVMGSVEIADPVGNISEIGPFRLLRQIGRGGMGVVYLGERRSDFEQQVALKIMPRFTADAAARARFAQERRILAQLRHPNICSILDGGELDDGTPWLAMEFVPGETVCAWSAGRGLGVRERIELFLQLCEAVQYAHRNLVIHRDLKDSNVLVDEAGHVKLLDFGIAKSLAPSAGDGHTALQDRFFSPMTAAPEQIRGERVTVATDVYALGALLHQLLCGFLPFERPQRPPHTLQREILEVPPPKMSEALQRERTTLPGAAFDAIAAEDAGTDVDRAIAPRALRGELDAIVSHCLRKDPAERYAEVGDLTRDLRAWLSGHPIAIARGDRLYRLGKFVRRHRLPVALGAAATASVLIALAVTLWQAAALRVQRDAAEAARQRSEIDRDRARAVAAFMRDTFEEADPGRTDTGGLLARDLIERGKRRLGGLEGQQDVQAELALLLAESDANLGLVRESDALWRAHAPAIEALAAVDPDVRWRARILRLSSRIVLESDGPALDAALTEVQRLADTPERQVQAARLQERLQSRRSEFGAAARTLEDAWRRHGSALNPSAALRLQTDLGNALISANRAADARRICDSIDRKRLREHDPALQIRALRLIVRELSKRGDADAALAAAVDQWRGAAETLYGEDSLEAAKVYEYMVGVSEDPREREKLIARAYGIYRAKLPPTSMARARAEYNIGYYHLYLRQRHDLAEPHLAQAVQIGRQATSRAHADVVTFELDWARTLNALGRHRQCLERLSSPSESPEDTRAAEQLSALHLELAKAAAALDRTAEARAELAAIRSLWRRLDRPLPNALTDTVRRFEAGLGGLPRPTPDPRSGVDGATTAISRPDGPAGP